jgi:hypothetical protein
MAGMKEEIKLKTTQDRKCTQDVILQWRFSILFAKLMNRMAMASLPWPPPCALVRGGDRHSKNRIWVHYFSTILTETEFC